MKSFFITVVSLIMVSCLASDVLPNTKTEKQSRAIKVFVKGQVNTKVIKVGEPIPLVITIKNDLDVPVYHPTFSIKCNDWNGETMNIELVDIYRGGEAKNQFLSHPVIETPVNISGFGVTIINPGSSLSIETDARKWKLRDGWLPGKYKVTIRVDNLKIDEYSTVSVLSDPVEFIIK